MAKVIVKAAFMDKFNSAIRYTAGQEVEFDDNARVADLASRGLVEVVKVELTVFGTIDLAAKVAGVIGAIASESEVLNLTLALDAEREKDKPRKKVIDALSARIAELTDDDSEDDDELEDNDDSDVDDSEDASDDDHSDETGDDDSE